METIMRWLRLHPEFKDQYARAKDEQMDAYAEEIVDIADDATNDFMEIEQKNGGTTVIFDKENIQRSKLRIEARQWMMGKLRPKKYGNNVIKVENQQLDKDGNPTDPPGSKTDAVLASALEAMKQVKNDTSTEEDAS